jgi:methionyl-tRNA synthetase
MLTDLYIGGVSNCCGASVYWGERCSECGEGCGVEEESDEEENIEQKEILCQ